MKESAIAIGFLPRERFSIAHLSLECLLDCTNTPIQLVIVDCNIPEIYRKRIENVVKDLTNVTYLRYDKYLLPNQSRNRLIQETSETYLCLIENDIFVEKNWLAPLVSACQENGTSGVASPHIMEGREPLGPAHFDWRHHRINEIPHPDGTKIEILPRTSWDDYIGDKFKRRRELFLESHCMLFHRDACELFGSFDEDHNSREEIDISLRLYHNDVPVWFEPESHVHFVGPEQGSLEPEEYDYFRFKWDLDRAYQSHKQIQERWNLVEIPTSIPFVKSRLSLLP